MGFDPASLAAIFAVASTPAEAGAVAAIPATAATIPATMGTLTGAAIVNAGAAAIPATAAAGAGSIAPWLLGGSALMSAGMGAMSLMTTQAQNEAMADAAEAQGWAAKEAAELEMGQAAEQNAIERQKRVSQARLLQSRLRVAAGEAGIGMGGTYQAINRQIGVDTALNQNIATRRMLQNYKGSQAVFSSRIAGMDSFRPSPIVEGFLGGMQGLSTGLSIGTSIAQIPGVMK